MKPIFVALFFCLVFVPKLIIVHGNKLSERLKNSGAKINGKIEVGPGEPLGKGGYGSVYKGYRMYRKRGKIVSKLPVAVKFVHRDLHYSARNEYSIYWYLDAIDNPSVEEFGIPAVYYYGKWKDFIVMAVTLCEESLREKRSSLSPLDALNIFRQFVIQSKYLHSHGIRHDDLKPDNILLRKHQTFLIDFNLGSKMEEDSHICTYKYKPRIMHNTGQIRRAIDDWESFFFAMAQMCGVPFKWFSFKDNLRVEELNMIYRKAKEDVDDISNKIYAIESPPLREVFVVFYKEIFSENAEDFPDYDRMYQLITDQIRNVSTPNQPIFFTWMDNEAVEEAKMYIETNGISDIRTIEDPHLFNGSYARVNFDYFNGRTTAGSSGDQKTRKSQKINCLAFFGRKRRSELSNKK